MLFFFLSLSFFLCVYFFVLFNNKCTVVQRFVAISSIIFCTRSWLHFIWSVCSIQLNTKHLFNSDENSNINGNHDRSVITTTAIHIYHTVYIYIHKHHTKTTMHTRRHTKSYYNNLSKNIKHEQAKNCYRDYIKCERETRRWKMKTKWETLCHHHLPNIYKFKPMLLPSQCSLPAICPR